MNGIRQLQHPSMRSLRQIASWFCNRQIPDVLHVEQTAMYVCMQLRDGKLCDVMNCTLNCWNPTLADNREVLEHHYAAKHHLVHGIWGTHKEDLVRGMLIQWPPVYIRCTNWYPIRAQVNMFKSQSFPSAQGKIAEYNDVHCSESDADHLEFMHSRQVDNQYISPAAENVDVVYTVHNVGRESRKPHTTSQRPLYIQVQAIRGYIYLKLTHQVNSWSQLAYGLYNCMIDDNDGHIPLPLVMFTCTTMRHALQKWKQNNGVPVKASKSMQKSDRLESSN